MLRVVLSHSEFPYCPHIISFIFPANISTCFNVFFRLIWRCDVAQRQINVETTLYNQRWSLQCWKTSHQHCLFQSWFEQRLQRRNNVAIFNVDFHNAGQRRNNVVNVFIWKKTVPPNISTSDQSCFIVVVQRRDNIDPTLKMKQIPTSDFQRCNVGLTLFQRWYNFMSMLFQRGLNVRKSYIETNRASISTDLQIDN